MRGELNEGKVGYYYDPYHRSHTITNGLRNSKRNQNSNFTNRKEPVAHFTRRSYKVDVGAKILEETEK